MKAASHSDQHQIHLPALGRDQLNSASIFVWPGM
jgi:hypothetical protein